MVNVKFSVELNQNLQCVCICVYISRKLTYRKVTKQFVIRHVWQGWKWTQKTVRPKLYEKPIFRYIESNMCFLTRRTVRYVCRSFSGSFCDFHQTEHRFAFIRTLHERENSSVTALVSLSPIFDTLTTTNWMYISSDLFSIEWAKRFNSLYASLFECFCTKLKLCNNCESKIYMYVQYTHSTAAHSCSYDGFPVISHIPMVGLRRKEENDNQPETSASNSRENVMQIKLKINDDTENIPRITQSIFQLFNKRAKKFSASN